jgi:hypothetical protein
VHIINFLVWVLVQFDDDVYTISRLQNIENEEGESGDNLNFITGSRCMAEFQKDFYPATIIYMDGLYLYI